MRRVFTLLFAVVMLHRTVAAQMGATEKRHLFIHVTLAPELHGPFSGRLLVFVAQGSGAKEVDASPFQAAGGYAAAKEVHDWAPGTVVDLDADDLVYPGPLSDAKPGDYQLQAVLDVGHTYTYSGRGAGDLLSDVVTLSGFDPRQGIKQNVTLSRVLEKEAKPAEKASNKNVHPFSFTSRALTRFWGRETAIQGYVVTPPSYGERPAAKFPTVYWTHGFGGDFARIESTAERFFKSMAEKKMPEMIWVVLNESCPTGTHEFADSVNNGPWGEALTSELIPHLEATYHMDAKPSGRFLQGHSSGGWATLWLQTKYPKIFGGTWSTSPDPSDFHDFTGPDLYAPHANLYRKPDGSAYPLVRDKGVVLATMEQVAKQERVIGPYGGQISSFDWVFSPRGPDGTPMPMFDRETGDVDPYVAAYWRDHYDIAHLVAKNWKTIGPDLRGKIHLFVGTADTFYLDGPAHRLQAVLDSLHAGAHFTFIPGRTHMDLYKVGDDPGGLFNQIAKEMYATARP
jgi:hypothetical protein